MTLRAAIPACFLHGVTTLNDQPASDGSDERECGSASRASCPSAATLGENPRSVRQFAISPTGGGVELLRAVYKSHRFIPHAHDTAVIGLVEGGAAYVAGAGEELYLGPGSVLVIPPGVIHQAYTIGPDPWQYRALYLTGAQLATLGPACVNVNRLLGSRPFSCSRPSVSAQVYRAHDALLDSAAKETSTPLDELADLVATLSYISAISSDAAERPTVVSAGLTRVRQVLDSSPARQLSLNEMASIAQLSRFSFAHSFKRAFGVAPHAYAMYRKIASAKTMLAAGGEVSYAAHVLGFADQSHLTRRFLSVVGVTPGEFRRAWRTRVVAA
jgi:AraC-like DNA-binding protein